MSGKSKPPVSSSAPPKTVGSRVSSAEPAPVQQDIKAGLKTPPVESGFPDPYKLLADSRRVLITKELTNKAKFINCVFGFCGVTRYRYFVKDAATDRVLFKARLSYSTSCNLCAGSTRHNYTLDIYSIPIDGSTVLKDKAKRGLFLGTSSSEKSTLASGGHGVMDLRNAETLGRVIPSPAGSFTVKEGSGATAFRIALPVSVGYGSSTSEMLVEDGATTALVGRIVKQWGRGDNDWTLMCCCSGSTENGSYTVDMSAVSNVKKRALLLVAGILADAASFQFRAAPPALIIQSNDISDSPIAPKPPNVEEKKSLLSSSS